MDKSGRVACPRGPLGVLVALLLAALLASCGDDPEPSAEPTSEKTAEQTPEPTREPTTEPAPETSSEPPGNDPVVINITIADGVVTPAGMEVEAEVGEPIELHVDSDAADELHVHSSPGHEYAIKAADDQVFTFSIDRPGQIEIETHETATVIAELVVS